VDAAVRLDTDRDERSDPEGEQERIDRLVLERAAAEVAQQDGIGGPENRGQSNVRHEVAEPGELHESGRERRRGAPAGDETCDDEDVAAAVAEEVARPLEPRLRLLPGEETFLNRAPEIPPERVRRVVAGEGAERGEEEDELERELSARRLDPGDDRRRLTRQQGENGVAVGDPEEDRIRPR
jgi:hypothetical protein